MRVGARHSHPHTHDFALRIFYTWIWIAQRLMVGCAYTFYGHICLSVSFFLPLCLCLLWPHLSVCLFLSASLSLSFMATSVCLSVSFCPSVCLSECFSDLVSLCLSMSLSVSVSVSISDSVSVCLSVSLCRCPPFHCLSACPQFYYQRYSVCLPACLSVCLSICLSVSLCLSLRLSAVSRMKQSWDLLVTKVFVRTCTYSLFHVLANVALL